MSGLIPALRCDKYESLRVKVVLATVTKTKSLRCSRVFAIAWVILALKFIKNCSSSAAPAALEDDFPLAMSILMIFNCVFMLS